jgi:hypothetical protein
VGYRRVHQANQELTSAGARTDPTKGTVAVVPENRDGNTKWTRLYLSTTQRLGGKSH